MAFSRDAFVDHVTRDTAAHDKRSGSGAALSVDGAAAAIALQDDKLPPVQKVCLMELGGLEPPTSWVRSRRSPN
jgi:hypothetical protein